jgi:hypothetical protein
MNTGQMMITAGAMMLISILVLSISSTQLTTQDSMQNSKFGILAISLASSTLEIATQKAFDQWSVDSTLTNTNQLTLKLGPGPGETSPETFNDYDDFHNYTNVDSTMPSALFTIKCTVDYVDPNKPGFISSSRTWHKMMTVTVTSPAMKDVVKLSKVYSYFKLP